MASACVVSDVFGRKHSLAAVFEPLVRDLVAADVEVPDGFVHTVEVGGGVDVNFAVGVFGKAFGDLKASRVVKALQRRAD